MISERGNDQRNERTICLPSDEDVSLRVDESEERKKAVRSEVGAGGHQERVDAFRLFLDRPRYPPTCFLRPYFKLFRIINELNRTRACRPPHCPRSGRKDFFHSGLNGHLRDRVSPAARGEDVKRGAQQKAKIGGSVRRFLFHKIDPPPDPCGQTHS